MPRYDAVMIPQGYRLPGSRTRRGGFIARCNAMFDAADHWLGTDNQAGERSRVRPARPGMAEKLFCTRSVDDTINFPRQHPLSGRPRYRWEPGPDGLEFGTLMPEEVAAQHAAESPQEQLIRRIKALEEENARLREMQ